MMTISRYFTEKDEKEESWKYLIIDINVIKTAIGQHCLYSVFIMIAL